MNLLGPLTNPAGARRQVVGVSDPGLLELVAGGLNELGHEHALVVHGEPGLDELSPIGPTTVLEVRAGRIQRRVVDPSDFGWRALDPAELAGGDPAHNAELVRQVLAGGGAPAARAAVALNAGAALFVAGEVDSLEAGVHRSEELLSQGAAVDRLEALQKVSQEVARG